MSDVRLVYVLVTHKMGKPEDKQTWRFSSEKDLVDTALSIFNEYPVEDAYTEFVCNNSRITIK